MQQNYVTGFESPNIISKKQTFKLKSVKSKRFKHRFYNRMSGSLEISVLSFNLRVDALLSGLSLLSSSSFSFREI